MIVRSLGGTRRRYVTVRFASGGNRLEPATKVFVMDRRSIVGLGLTVLFLAACDGGPTEINRAQDLPDQLKLNAAILGGTPLVWSENDFGNGHAYDAIGVPEGINWADARDAAYISTLDGCTGYLATLTTMQENAFIVANLPQALPPGRRGYWIGGWQPPGSSEPDGGWTWITGEPFEFANWNAPNEPNDWRWAYPESGEDAVHLWDDGSGRWNDLASQDRTPGYVVEYDAACAAAITEIMIGVKPGRRNTPRPINPRSWGVVTVVVFSTAVAEGEVSDFAALDVDVQTVTLGDGQTPEASVALRKNGTAMVRLRDVDGDGDEDMVLQFRIRDLQDNGDLEPGTTELVLAGQTSDAQAFSGMSAIRLVP